MPRDVHAVDPAAVIATHALRALAVMAAFESTRAELAHSSQLVSDIGECVGTGIGVGWCACVCVCALGSRRGVSYPCRALRRPSTVINTRLVFGPRAWQACLSPPVLPPSPLQ